MMNLDRARQVVQAINAQDKDGFYSLFITPSEVKVTDDGRPHQLETWASREVFADKNHLTIQQEFEENDTVKLVGEYATAAYGTFNTYWNFTFNDDGKVIQMDVGAVDA